MIPFGIKILNPGAHTVASPLRKTEQENGTPPMRRSSEDIGHEQNKCFLPPYRRDSQ